MARKPTLPRQSRRLQAYYLKGESHFKARRDRKEIDLDVVKSLASIGATQDEIASVLGVSKDWLQKERERDAALAIAMDEGISEMKTSLRRVQMQMALSGNVAMLIWMGKQVLGQADKQENNSKTEINITVQRAMEELRAIPRGQLLEAQALLTASPAVEHEESPAE